MTPAAAAKKARKMSAPPLTAAPESAGPAGEYVDPASLRPWPKNPRKNDGEPVARVAESIRRFGFAAPIVARKATREIIAGHTRWKAAQLLKLSKVPVRFIDCSEREAHLLALADNRLGELAEWDDPALHAILASYDISDQLLAGWNEKDMRELERAIADSQELPDDEVPEPPKNPVTKPGDLWQLGKHRLVCGDCTDERVVSLARAKLMPVLMDTDPPYGVDYDAAWRREAGLNRTKRVGKVENDDKRASWLEAYKLFPGDVSYIWCDALVSDVVAREIDSAGFERRSHIMWRKPSIVVGRGHYHWQHETCWYAVRQGKSAKWGGDRKQSTVWDIARKDGQQETEHSTQKPLECMARPIRNHGQQGDVVYDPFSGSGTTMMACEHLGRICVAIELSPAYCDVIVERWQKLTGEKAKRG